MKKEKVINYEKIYIEEADRNLESHILQVFNGLKKRCNIEAISSIEIDKLINEEGQVEFDIKYCYKP